MVCSVGSTNRHDPRRREGKVGQWSAENSYDGRITQRDRPKAAEKPAAAPKNMRRMGNGGKREEERKEDKTEEAGTREASGKRQHAARSREPEVNIGAPAGKLRTIIEGQQDGAAPTMSTRMPGTQARGRANRRQQDEKKEEDDHGAGDEGFGLRQERLVRATGLARGLWRERGRKSATLGRPPRSFRAPRLARIRGQAVAGRSSPRCDEDQPATEQQQKARSNGETFRRGKHGFERPARPMPGQPNRVRPRPRRPKRCRMECRPRRHPGSQRAFERGERGADENGKEGKLDK